MGGCTGGNFSGPVCATSQLERLASFFYKSLGSIAPSSVYLWYCMFSGSKAASSPAQQPPGIQSMLAPCQCPESGKTDTSHFSSLLKSQNSRHMFLSSSHLPRKKPQVMLLLLIALNCTGCSKLHPTLRSQQSPGIQIMLTPLVFQMNLYRNQSPRQPS